jgi:hypothetical protein
MTASNLAWQRDIWDYVSDRGRMSQKICDAYAAAVRGASPRMFRGKTEPQSVGAGKAQL